MTESAEPAEPPAVDLSTWNRGLCHDELDLFPNEVALVVAVMVAEQTGQVASAEWILNTTGLVSNHLAALERRRWVTSERQPDKSNVWKATPRAWRAMGFEAPQKRKAS